MIWLLALTLVSQTAEVPEPVARARALLEQGRSLEALETLRAASRAEPGDARIWSELGILLGAAGRPTEAFSAFERAIGLEPENEEYALAYGELLFRAGEVEAALPYLEKASAPPSPLPEALLVLAAAREKLGDTDRMFATLANYLALVPEDGNVRRLLGDKLENDKRFDEALAVYRDALALDEDDPVFLHRAAAVLGRSRETYEEAERYAHRALEEEPDHLEARLLLARILERTDRNDEALRELVRARDDHPEAAEVYYRLSQALQRAGRGEAAAEAAARFQELSAAEKEAEEREARVAVTYKEAAEALSQGAMIEAESVFRRVLDIDPDHAQTKSMLAKIAFSKGDLGEATGWIAEAIDDDPEVGEYHYLHALFLARGGRAAKAEPPLERALELDPTFPDAWSLLGTLLLDSGRAGEAVECFRKAVTLEPGSAAAYLNLAYTYGASGEEELEREAMERYRELSR